MMNRLMVAAVAMAALCESCRLARWTRLRITGAEPFALCDDCDVADESRPGEGF